MSKTGRINLRRGARGVPRNLRHISVRTVPRPEPDLPKLSRAIIALVLAEAEAEARKAASVPSAVAEGEPSHD